jgi:hypothetical protein
MHSDAPPSPPVTHVFVDFENLKTIDGDTLGRKNFTFHLILGPTNKTLPVEAVARMMENAQAVTLIRSPKSGKNAADFVLAYYLGQAAAADPKGYFHILSADEGFDSLVELLRSRKMKVKRHGTWDELKALIEPKVAVVPEPAAAKLAPPVVKSGESGAGSSGIGTVAGTVKKAVSGGQESPPSLRGSLSAGAEKLLENLRKSAKARPKKRATLVSHAKSSLGKNATDAQGEAVVEELRKAGKLKFDEKGAVEYRV